MIPYLAAFCLPVLLYPLRKRSRLGYVFLLAGLWALFAGLREGIGGSDYFAYADFYGNLQGTKPFGVASFEPLFTLFGLGAKVLGLSYHAFLGLVCLVGTLPAVYVIDKRCGDSALSLFYYGMEWMLYASFVILRQSLALGLAFLAIEALFDHRRFRFLIIVLVAGFFHASAFAFLPLIFLNSELKPKFRVAVFGLTAIAFLLVLSWSNLTFDYSKFPTRVVRFLNYIAGAHERLNPFNYIEILLFWLLIIRYAGDGPPLERNLYFMYSCIAMLSMVYSVTIRFGYFYEVGLVFLLPRITSSPKASRLERILLPAGIMAYALAKVCRWLLLNGGGNGGFLPYRTIFG